ncbi:LytR family transcriptional regulator [Corynebacterium diphtheriae]|nr:LytR family transcriptional regulator [Corynebacterium diphtheriae]CAB0925840.1 LytR family transcriptional regulator [Corynebacterium diphtheriae]
MDEQRNQGEFLLGSDGKPLLDRYGRPIRRRRSAPRRPKLDRTEPRRAAPSEATRVIRTETTQMPAQPGAVPQERPRQYIPTPEEQQRYRAQQYYQQQPVQPAQPGQPGFEPNRRYRRSQVTLPPEPKKRRRLRLGGCIAGLVWTLVIVMVLGIAGTLWLDTRLNRVQAAPPQHIAKTSGTNWLLVGSDSRAGLSEEDVQRLGTGGDIGSMRTDTIMVLHIPSSGKATLMSIPRDSYVEIPGYGMDKINASFTYGGAPLLTQTVENATGLRINHYAEIGMGGLANVVDAVGGIEVCPAEPIDDPLAGLNIAAGCQKVDGPTALGYVRTRHTALGDLDRVQRQREFFAALVNKVTSTSTLANPFRIMPTINTVAGSFTVGKKDHAWHLVRVALAMREGVETVTVPYAGFADYDVGNVVLWDEVASEELFASLR